LKAPQVFFKGGQRLKDASFFLPHPIAGPLDGAEDEATDGELKVRVERQTVRVPIIQPSCGTLTSIKACG
jgi:hypothetical protein